MFETDVSKVADNLDKVEIGGELHVARSVVSRLLVPDFTSQLSHHSLLYIPFSPFNVWWISQVAPLLITTTATAFLPQRRGYTVCNYYVVREDVNHSTSQTFHRYSAPCRWHVKFFSFYNYWKHSVDKRDIKWANESIMENMEAHAKILARTEWFLEWMSGSKFYVSDLKLKV